MILHERRCNSAHYFNHTSELYHPVGTRGMSMNRTENWDSA
jgi:hypothetical protein